MQQLIFVFAFLWLFFTTGACGQAPAEAEKEQFSLHTVSKFCRYNNGKVFPSGASTLSISFTGIGGGWPGAASLAAPDSIPLANLFNSFDSVVALPGYRREWFYPEGELDVAKKLRADMWRNNRRGTAAAEYSKQTYGYQRAKIEHMRTWVTAGEPVAYERNCVMRVSRTLTVDNVTSPVQEHLVLAKIPANDTHSSGWDLKPGTLTKKINGVTVETPFTNTYKEKVDISLLPVEVAVDADRDGEITFDQKDKTTAEKPFRFWINNDQDNVEADEPILVETPDSFDSDTIQTKRDLEDFCRLKLHVGLTNQTLRDGDFQIGLMFRGSSGATPGIRIWKNQSNDGNLDYLKDHNAAAAQIALGAFEKFPPLQVTLIPKAYWESRTDSTAHLIFEGTSRGKGELVVTIHDKHGAKLGEGPGVWMDLLDVREMYQRARIANEAEQIPSPTTNPTPPAQTWNWDPWNWPYSEDPQATEKTAIFVHGWRLKYMDYMNWSDTSYKRLWHQGFKGKFYSFRWATFSGDNNGLPYGYDENIEGTAFPPGGTTYNASEYRAWLCGPTLASFVNQLPNAGNRSLFAHSMGNVISGAALRSGMSIQRYAMCNAAMAAMAYDPDPILRNVDNIFTPVTIPELRDTPDTDPDPAIRANYGLENKFNLPGNPTVFNFGLPDDSALGSWSANNLFFKPNNQYLYTENSILQPFPLVYQATPVSSFRSVTAVPEAMGYVTKSRTRAAGADLRTSGKIAAGNKIDMRNWFNDTHSAQWRWSNHSTELFWKELSIRLILKEESP